MTRWIFISLVLTVGCTHATSAAPAAPPAGAAQPASEAGRRPDADEVVARLADALALTEAQRAEIRPIIVERQERLAAIRAGDGGRRRKARAAKAVLEDTDRQLERLLTDEQRGKYAALKQELREQARERMRAQRSGAR